MRDNFYSPNAAGEATLKDACDMQFGLISKARMNYFNDIEKRITEIARIKALCFRDLKKEYNQSFNNTGE